MQAYKAAAANWQRKGAKAGEPQPEEPEKPVGRRFTVSDVTSEALAVRLEQNPRGLLLVRDELAGFFTGPNQYKAGGRGADESAFLFMHGARLLVIDRKNPDKPSIFVPLANLSVVGAIQPGVLRRVLTRDRMESGMAARFLLAYPPPRAIRWKEKAVDAAVEDRIATMFDWLLSMPLNLNEASKSPEPAHLPLAPEAKERWISFHDEHAAEQAELHGDLSAAWAKLSGYAARLGLLCELANWATGDNWEPPTYVGAGAIEAGITLARWFSAETKRVYAILDETEDDRQVRELGDYVRQRGGNITARDLARGPRHYRQNDDLADADLHRLVNVGIGRWIDQPTGEQGGRPTRVFQMNPIPDGDETTSKQQEIKGSVAVASDPEADDEQGEWAA